ncbi:hypothetical protein [Nonomuraea sp. B19D2]|uniref:hypothetical protein n=1 Tax=Nonomuraea sp. B19D2 TaxID=3159561 RepID=UPI0032D9DA7B
MGARLSPNATDDQLLRELGDRISDLVSRVLDQPEFTEATQRSKLKVSQLAGEATTTALASMSATNVEIAAIREADAAIAQHEISGRTQFARVAKYALPISLIFGAAAFAITAAYVTYLAYSWNTLLQLFGAAQTITGVSVVSLLVLFIVSFLLHLAASVLGIQSDTPGLFTSRFTTGTFIGALCLICSAAAPISLIWLSTTDAAGLSVAAAGGLFTFLVLLFGYSVLYLRYGAWYESGFAAFKFYTPLHRQVIAQVGGIPPGFAALGSLSTALVGWHKSFTRFGKGVSRAWSSKQPKIGHAYDDVWLARKWELDEARFGAIATWDDAMMDRVIAPDLRARINQLIAPGFSLASKPHDAPGLRQMRAQEYVVPVTVFKEFKRLLDRIDGGAIGIAGPRGSGKTTLLEAQRSGLFLEAGVSPPISIMESVPVEYEAREFALHLYGRLCRAVIEYADRKQPARANADSSYLLPKTFQRLTTWSPLILGIGFAATWLLQSNSSLLAETAQFFTGVRDVVMPFIAANWLAFAGSCLIAATIVYALRDRHRAQTASLRVNNSRVEDIASLRRFAESKLDEVTFQQKYTSGWSGKLKLPLGAEASRTRSVEWAKQGKTYPEILHDFREFVTTALAVLKAVPNLPATSIVIVIDELDKIPSIDKAQQFTDEIKGLFVTEAPGCLFLVSVSNEALAAFEQRGLPVRDAFDSAFDAVVRIRYLNLTDTMALLRGRVVGLSDVLLCLCYCMAGGLPRELIRIAREIVDLTDRGIVQIDEIAKELLTADLSAKISGARSVISRNSECEPWTSALLQRLSSRSIGDFETDAMLSLVSNPPVLSEDERPELQTLSRIQTSSIGYIYYCATLKEVFSSTLDENSFQEALKSGTASSFENLAVARQMFAESARLAWLSVSSFRTAWGLKVIDPPGHTGD